jgi:hypothetical protein
MNKRRSSWVGLVVLALLPWLMAIDGGSLAERQARLASLSPEQIEQLLRKKEVFDALPPEERERLRRLDRDLNAEPNAERLLQTLRGYHEWLTSLRTDERIRIKDAPPEKCIAEIESLLAQHRQRDIGLTNETRLPTEDFEALMKWTREFSERKKDEIARLVTAIERNPAGGQRRSVPLPMVRLVVGIIRGSVSEEDLDALIGDEDLSRLSQTLSAKGAKILSDQKTKREKVLLILRWINASTVRRPSEAELMRFFNEDLNEEMRAEIIRLGPLEGRERLVQQFNREMRLRRGPGRPNDAEPPRILREPPLPNPNGPPAEPSREPSK